MTFLRIFSLPLSVAPRQWLEQRGVSVRRAWAYLGILALMVLVVTLGFQSLGPPLAQKSNPSNRSGTSIRVQDVPRDLVDLRALGELRVIARLGPGGIILGEAERALLLEFAESQGLRAEFIGAAMPQLLSVLEQGQADLVAGAPAAFAMNPTW